MFYKITQPRQIIIHVITVGPHLTGPEELCWLVDPPLHQLFHHVSLVHIHRDQCLQGLPKNRVSVINI
jgi:hypothetical protein